MQIRWFFEDIEPGAIRGPVATSEDGNYQIVFDFYAIRTFYLYKNSDCIYACKVDDDPFDFSYFLAKCHRKIERWEEYYHISDMPDPECIVKPKDYCKCGNCHHLIFKDYEHHEGLCNLTRLHRRFEDLCVHDEDIM